MTSDKQFDGEVPEEAAQAATPGAEPDAASASADSSAEPGVADDTQQGEADFDSADPILQKEMADLAAERLADLQRITAEFKNFRKRTEEQLALQQERAKGDAAKAILPVLDDIDLAEKHNDLTEGSAFATIAQKLRTVGEHLGLVKFGAAGDAFDHNVHDAVLQQPSAEVEVPTVAEVVSPGYRLGDTLVRAAKVIVSTPQD